MKEEEFAARQRLESSSLIERVPKEIVPTAASLESDYPFVVLEEDPVIKFSIVIKRIKNLNVVSLLV